MPGTFVLEPGGCGKGGKVTDPTLVFTLQLSVRVCCCSWEMGAHSPRAYPRISSAPPAAAWPRCRRGDAHIGAVAGRRGEHLEEGARWRPPPGGLADLAPWLGAANRRRLVPSLALTQVLKFVSERQVLMEWWSADGTIEWTRTWSHLGG